MEEIVKSKLLTGTGIVGVSLLLAASPALAEDATDPSVYLQAVMDNLWVFIAGILVFFMQAGFALVEAGLTRSKNVANIMAKNIAELCVNGVRCVAKYSLDNQFVTNNEFVVIAPVSDRA